MITLYIFLSLSLVACIGFFYTYYKSQTFKSKAKKIKARVISLEQKTSYDQESNTTTTNYYPVFSFTYKNRRYQERSNIGRNPARYKIGDQPFVWFLWESPTTYTLKETGWFSLNIYWVLCLFATLVFMGVSGLVYMDLV